MNPPPAAPARGFVPLYTLAYCGLFVAFMPFVSILLQVKVVAIDPVNRVALLGWTVLGGAVVASVANIAAGWLSDLHWRRSHSRRLPIAVGLVLLALAFVAIHRAGDRTALLVAIALWQVALNLMFAPMVAVMADEVPDAAKGRVSGLLGISHPIGMLSAAAVTAPLFPTEGARFAVNVALAAAMIVPFLLLGRERGAGNEERPAAAAPVAVVRGDLIRAWIARLAMQMLPSPETRGRDLAVLNLTNTLPACVPPLLAALVPAGAGLGAVFVALALVAALGGGTALAIRSER